MYQSQNTIALAEMTGNENQKWIIRYSIGGEFELIKNVQSGHYLTTLSIQPLMIEHPDNLENFQLNWKITGKKIKNILNDVYLKAVGSKLVVARDGSDFDIQFL